MAKKYVVENAGLNCQYGQQSWLIISKKRHVEISGKNMANETDYKKSCIGCGGFGSCHSPHVSQGLTQLYHDALSKCGLSDLRQLGSIGGEIPCQYQPGPQWMDTKEDVYIAKYHALMEDSWTFCTYGLGIITLINSGQSEDPASALEEHLKQLETVVDRYIQETGISKKNKNDLLNSIVLWNGYGYLPWGTEISQERWDFGIYMEKEYPALTGYFERGIYLFDDQTGSNIDVSYMAGISVALKKSPKEHWSVLGGEAFFDDAAYNGYLEACRQGAAENAVEAMKGFLYRYNSPEYDGSSRYTDHLGLAEGYRDAYEQMYEQGCSMDGSHYDPSLPLEAYGDPEEILKKMEEMSHWNEWSREEKDAFILQREMSPYIGDKNAEDLVTKLYESAGKEIHKWEQQNRGD